MLNSSNTELALKLWNLPRPKVLVVGDNIVDVDLYGHIDRVSAEESSCPVFTVDRQEYRQGGASAVAEMSRALGSEVTLITGQASIKTRHFIGERQVWRSDSDSTFKESPPEGQINRAIRVADIVLIADYGKGFCTPKILREVIDTCKEKNILCLVDPARGVKWDRYAGATAVKCNLPQWTEETNSDLDLGSMSSTFIITRGEQGLTRYEHPIQSFHYHYKPRKLKDVTGAGDSVLASLGVSLGGGLDWDTSCKIANTTAGLKVEKHGASPVSRAEVVLDLLGDSKVIPPELLPTVSNHYRKTGKKVSFTNGCFDIFHAGHLQCLKRAKGLSDVLVVGLNSDDSVRKLKGPSRPLTPQDQRSEVLASVSCVDYVVIFKEDTPKELVRLLRPDFLVKGEEYKNLPIAGAEYAGEVVFIPLLPNCSTNNLESRIPT